MAILDFDAEGPRRTSTRDRRQPQCAAPSRRHADAAAMKRSSSAGMSGPAGSCATGCAGGFGELGDPVAPRLGGPSKPERHQRLAVDETVTLVGFDEVTFVQVQDGARPRESPQARQATSRRPAVLLRRLAGTARGTSARPWATAAMQRSLPGSSSGSSTVPNVRTAQRGKSALGCVAKTPSASSCATASPFGPPVPRMIGMRIGRAAPKPSGCIIRDHAPSHDVVFPASRSITACTY